IARPRRTPATRARAERATPFDPRAENIRARAWIPVARADVRTCPPEDRVSTPSMANPGTKSTLTVTDNRTGKTYEVPIADGTIRALDLRKIKVDDADFGLMTYDPAFMNTAACRSAITYIDGDA